MLAKHGNRYGNKVPFLHVDVQTTNGAINSCLELIIICTIQN